MKKKINLIVKACVLLNFIRKKEGRASQLLFDFETNIIARPSDIRHNLLKPYCSHLANDFISEVAALLSNIAYFIYCYCIDEK